MYEPKWFLQEWGIPGVLGLPATVRKIGRDSRGLVDLRCTFQGFRLSRAFEFLENLSTTWCQSHVTTGSPPKELCPVKQAHFSVTAKLPCAQMKHFLFQTVAIGVWTKVQPLQSSCVTMWSTWSWRSLGYLGCLPPFSPCEGPKPMSPHVLEMLSILLESPKLSGVWLNLGNKKSPIGRPWDL